MMCLVQGIEKIGEDKSLSTEDFAVKIFKFFLSDSAALSNTFKIFLSDNAEVPEEGFTFEEEGVFWPSR